MWEGTVYIDTLTWNIVPYRGSEEEVRRRIEVTMNMAKKLTPERTITAEIKLVEN